MNVEVDVDRKGQLAERHKTAQAQYFDLLDRAISSPDLVDSGLRDKQEFVAFLNGSLEQKGFTADAPAVEIQFSDSETKEVKEMLRGLRRASNAMSVSADEHVRRGNAYYGVNDFEQAVAEFSEAVGLAPNNLTALSSLGTSLMALSKYEEAVKTYDQALSESDNPNVHRFRGIALFNMDKPAEALKAHDRAIDLDSNASLIGRARALERLGDTAGAVKDYEQELRRDPGSFAIYALSRRAWALR